MTRIHTTCPECKTEVVVTLTPMELQQARDSHTLIIRTVNHYTTGHVLTLYIDGEGTLRRKYCFAIAQKTAEETTAQCELLGKLFTQLIQQARIYEVE